MKDKKFRIITSLIILLPAVVGLLLWKVLPDELPTHFDGNGQTDGWSSKAFAVFAPPLILLAAHWLCIWAAQWDRRNWGHNEKMMKIVLWIFPAVSVVVMTMVYATALGYEWNISGVMMVLLGLMFIGMGNYLPKCRQNATLGIKLPWTLYNEENWNRTHRFGGKCWVAGGVGFLALSFVTEKWFAATMVLLLVVLTGVPTLYSWLLYRRQVKNGTWTQSEGSRAIRQDPVMRKVGIAGTIAAVGILVLAAVLMFTGEIDLVYGEDELTIEASYWQDRTVRYEDITNLELREDGVDGSRTFGFGSPRLLMGEFQNEEFGSYTRYTYTGCAACVVVRLGEQVLVLSGEDVASTMELCARLTEQIE